MLLNAYATHRSPPPLDFPHALLGRRDRSDPELAPHLDGFAGFVTARGTRPMTSTRYAVLRHLERVRHHLSIEVDEAQAAAFAAWARAANAIVFRTDGCVVAPDGAVLVDPRTGEPEAGAQVPYPAEAVRRKAASDVTLQAMGHRVPRSLPPVVGDVEVELRSGSDAASRCLALLACAVRADSLATGAGMPAAEIAKRIPLGVAAMSPKEAAFFAAPEPGRQEIVDHLWRHEALAALGWALGVLDALPVPPATPCDAAAVSRAFLERDGPAFVAGAELRPASEILDALDLTFRLHWVTTEARVKKVAPVGLDPGVVLERHHALNWLTGFEDAAWDDVTTPT